MSTWYEGGGGLTCLIRQAANQKDKYHKICLKKQNIPVRELCKGLPPEFGTLLCYCRNLKSETPPPFPPFLFCDRVDTLGGCRR